MCGNETPTPGDYFAFLNVTHEAIPLADPDNQYQYGFVFDRDGDVTNNCVPVPDFPNDFFSDTDYWIQMLYDAGWTMTASEASDGSITDVETAGQVIMNGNVWMLLLPADEFDVPDPDYRITNFRHDGAFGFNGNWDADVQPPVGQPKRGFGR